MNNVLGGLRLCSYNCRSLKNSFTDIRNLCESYDIVLLQEHWLLPFELGMLNEIHSDFMSFGVSAVDTSVNVLKGRPYGGTAILYNKVFSNAISVVNCHESRMCAINIQTNYGPMLIVNVYMPTDLSDDNSYAEYVDMCTKIITVFSDSDAVSIVAAGDFNCRTDSRFHKIFVQFLADHDLICIDHHQLNNVFTYVSDDGLRSSWIDHIICSKYLSHNFTDVKVLYGMVCSDHRPICAKLMCSVADSAASSHSDTDVRSRAAPNWSRVSCATVDTYRYTLDNYLCNIDIPRNLLSCTGVCSDSAHRKLIDSYYDNVVKCISCATDDAIPLTGPHQNQHNIPGWSDYVAEKHDISRQAFLNWVYDGKPKCGPSFQHMYTSRAAFKQALRYCKRNKEQLQADALAHSHKNMDAKHFWKKISKTANYKATTHVNKIGNAVGEKNISCLWYDYFYNLYNSVPDNGDRDVFMDACSTANGNDVECISVYEVKNAIDRLKTAKSAGPNGLFSESFTNSGVKLWIHLSLFYTFCFRHGYLPERCIDINIIPLVKNKCGDLTDMNNYRAIALANVETKILERIILAKVVSHSDYDKYQFGFKKGYSTSLCAGVVKQTIEYYINRGSHVFVCFIDYCKAFDKVNYWILFKQLLDDGVSNSIVTLLAYWYSHQQASVIWLNTRSRSFFIGNGTKQGGIISPYLFTRYIRVMLSTVASSRVGCHIGDIAVNIFAYADDVVLLAPSWHAMQQLIQMVEKCCSDLGLVCNVKKTKCMCVNPLDKSKIVSKSFPQFSINGHTLQFVDEFRYLGHVITSNVRDDLDINREVRNMYMRTNMLTQRFRRCSPQVKIVIFRAFCICLYGVSLWSRYNNCTMLKFKYCYHKCMKKFFGYSKYHSVTEMLLQLRLPSFDTVIHNNRCSFFAMWNNHDNGVVKLMRCVRPSVYI